ncbi:hypothetical protein AOA57_00085, partial [Pseudomonas sp. 2588-5]
MMRARQQFEKELGEYVSTLSYRVNKAGEEAVTKLPIGILLYNEERHIQWTNPYLTELMEQELIGAPISVFSKKLMEDVD